jgi:ribonuclease HII
MWKFEKSLYSEGIKHIAGVDEAGRGPLAGPVVAASVIFQEEFILPSIINDSKQLTQKAREEAFVFIFENALSVGIGLASEIKIEKINILQATRLAMIRAVGSLKIKPDYLLIDGTSFIDTTIPQKIIKKGDSLSASIAAASIIAKVTRDRIMGKIDARYPAYMFGKHKGYGTKDHLEKIRKFALILF